MSGVLRHADLVRAVDGLMTVDARRGLRRIALHFLALNLLLLATFLVPGNAAFLGMAVITGLVYTSVMMTTHDAIHRTLTGIAWVDEVVPRLFSWFIFWPHGLYAELHRLHHKLNGRDLDDPENPTPTRAAYEAGGPLRRFLIRNQWWLSLLVYGGFGMIVRHVAVGRRLARTNARVRRAMQLDAAGITVALAVTLAVIITTGVTWKFFVYLFVVERIMGYCQQLRSWIEHYGLWGERATPIETALYNCRNIATSRLVSRFFDGLNYHSVHHAFPRIPPEHLATAHERISALCAAAGQPLPTGEAGYLRTIAALAQGPRLIEGDARQQAGTGEAA